ncbi:MAG: SLBB domain-containing protein [Chitinivibrionales bacterium]
MQGSVSNILKVILILVKVLFFSIAVVATGFSQELSSEDFSGLSASEKARLMDKYNDSIGDGTRIPEAGRDSASLFIPSDSPIAKPVGLDTPDIKKTKADSIIAETPDTASKKKGLKRYSAHVFGELPSSIFSSTTSNVGKDYALKAGDKLTISLWGEVEKEEDIVINNRGKAFVKNLGLISFNGLNLGEAENVLRNNLKGVYSGLARGQTSLSLRIRELSPAKVFMLGEVKNPGGYVFHGNTTIFQALYQAGGPTQNGTVREIRINRQGEYLEADLYDYLLRGEEPIPSVLRDGDIIFLDQAASLVKITGDISREYVYELEQEEGVRELINYAGGIKPTAANHKIILKRVFEDGRMDFLNLKSPRVYLDTLDTFPLKSGDSLHIAKSTVESRDNVTVRGAVMYPGTYQYEKGMGISDVLESAGGLRDEAMPGRVQVIRPHENGSKSMFSQPASIDRAGEREIQSLDTVVIYNSRDFHVEVPVTISGAVKEPGDYEYKDGMTVNDLIVLANGYLPAHEKGSVLLSRRKKGGMGSTTERINIDESYEIDSNEITLEPWDHVEVPFDPEHNKPEKVVLKGAFRYPGTYVLEEPEEKLKTLIERAGGFKDEAYPGGAKFKRSYNEAGRIAVDVEAAMDDIKLHNVSMRDGDTVEVPFKKVSITVSGAVANPSNVLFVEGEDIEYYIDKAGGMTRLADDKRIWILFADGDAATEDNIDRDIEPGSQIFVPSMPEPDKVDFVALFSSIASIVASTATIFLAISNLKNASD